MQTEILKDERVTHAEMERALLAVVSCVEGRGFDAELTRFEPTGGFEFWVDDGDTDGVASGAVLTTCQDRFLSRIAEPYRAQNGPSQEQIEAEEQRLRNCLAARGYDVEGLPRSELLQRVAQSDYVACDPG